MRTCLRKSTLLLLTLLVSVVAFADSRSVEEAKSEAVNFISSKSSLQHRASSQQALSLSYTLPMINSSEAAAYLFQIGEDGGFVLVSADDNTTTILGYASEGYFDATNMPENMQVWFQHYAEEISWASKNGVAMAGSNKASGSAISPLLGDIVWNQDKPFWNQCPLDSDGNRSYTGCVATAATQIMRFWNYPQQGTGSHSYTWTKSDGSTQELSADFGSTTYDWANMKPNYNNGYTSTQANAVATLMYHMGVATEMGYTSNGSGTQTELAAQALYKYFGYDKSMRALRPDYIGFNTFGQKVLGELQAGRPVLFSGATEQQEGHAFVCDGYDGQYYHINWGWGGYQNEYFALSALDPEAQGIGGAASGEGYHVGILGVVGIMPDQGGELAPGSLGTQGLKLVADQQIQKTTNFTIKVNQILNTGISDYEGGAIGLAVVNEDNQFVSWFYAFWSDELVVGTYYPDEYDFSGNLSKVTTDGNYKIVPIFTDADQTQFWFMDVAEGSPQYFEFTKSGNTITFAGNETPDPGTDYSISNLQASASGSTISFSFDSEAPYNHVKIYNSQTTLVDQYISSTAASLNNVPAGTWTVWVRAADANKNDVGDPATVSVTVEDTPQVDYNVYNLTASSEGSTVYFSFESEAPKFHVKVYNDSRDLANGIIDFKNVQVSNVPDGEWTVWVRPCDANEQYYLAEAASTTVVVNTTPQVYKLTYYVDGTKYKTYEYAVGTAITPEAEPTKTGYTFSGWSEIPATMPDHDVDVTGTFRVNQYTITFDTDGGSAVASITQDYGTKITKPADPTKTGYTFLGWNPAIPETMPAENMTIKAQWTINSYKLTYMVDGSLYKEYTLNYGATITPEAEPTKEGYTFSGWSEIPATMPAHDVEVNGSFEVNIYKVSYYVDENLVHEDEVAFGETFELWVYDPQDDDLTFNGWIGEKYDTMPAHDISYKADITSGISYVYGNSDNVEGIYTLDGKKVEKLHQGVYLLRMKDGTTRKFVNK